MGGQRDKNGNSQGSWFSSGYYGHFRSKHRNDFLNQYRQQSKPSPPQKFHDMIVDRPTHHNFSHHDNRFSFLNTVDSFQGKLGKRKVSSTNKSKFVPDFIAWVPHRKEIEMAGPKVSIYRDTYKTGAPERVPQILVPSVRMPRPPAELHQKPLLATPFLDGKTAEAELEPMQTTYQLNHRHCQPNRSLNTDMNTGMIESEPVPEQKTMTFINPKVSSIHERPAPSMTRMRRSRIASAPAFRSSVAACMVWHGYGDEEEIQRLPGQRERPKTVIGLLPDISNTEACNSAVQDTLPAIAKTEPSYSSHYGNTPSATSTVPMDTIINMPMTGPSSSTAAESGLSSNNNVQKVMLSESV